MNKLFEGTKKDLRNDQILVENLRKQRRELVRTEEGQQMADRIHAVSFIECSAKTREGIREVLTETARVAIYNSTNRKKSKKSKIRNKCLIM